MPPEEGGMGGGNIFTNRIAGIPGFVWLLGAGVLAYFIFFRKSASGQSAGSPSTSGGGGTITTGNTTIDKGAVTVTVQQNPNTSQSSTSTATTNQSSNQQPTANNPQPKPPTTKKKTTGKAVKVPDVVGQRAAFGISSIEAQGLEAITNPFRNPKNEYEVTSETPKAGTSVPEGTRVTLGVKVVK